MSELKRMENRSCMSIPARGCCAMSVSKKFCRQEYENLVVWSKEHYDPSAFAQLLKWDEVKSWLGCLIGTMDYDAMDCVLSNTTLAHECRIWNEDYSNWWMLPDIRRLPIPIPCRGNARTWILTTELTATISVQWSDVMWINSWPRMLHQGRFAEGGIAKSRDLQNPI